VTRFSATAEPTPDPVEPAVPLADETVVEVTLIVASADGDVNEPVSSAFVATLAIVSPSEPATPTDAAAPEMPSLEQPAPPVVASRSSNVADAAPAIVAVLVTFASVIATPAPTAAEPPVA